MRTGLNHHSCALPRVLAVFFALGFAGQLSFCRVRRRMAGPRCRSRRTMCPLQRGRIQLSTIRRTADCGSALRGVYSPYTCETFGELTETDIEHIVARSEAHDSGLCSALPERKREFARDIRNLTLSAPHLNRNLKGAKDAADWRPDENRCWFAWRVIDVRTGL